MAALLPLFLDGGVTDDEDEVEDSVVAVILPLSFLLLFFVGCSCNVFLAGVDFFLLEEEGGEEESFFVEFAPSGFLAKNENNVPCFIGPFFAEEGAIMVIVNSNNGEE